MPVQSIRVPDPPKKETGTLVVPSPALAAHSKFSVFMEAVGALEPLVLAGVSPFIKNPQTGTIVATEAPIAQAFFQALGKL